MDMIWFFEGRIEVAKVVLFDVVLRAISLSGLQQQDGGKG